MRKLLKTSPSKTNPLSCPALFQLIKNLPVGESFTRRSRISAARGLDLHHGLVDL